MGQIKNIILQELQIKNKIPYGDGTQHAVYLSTKNPNTVFKVVKPDFEGSSKQLYDWIKIFKENPDLFPKVFRSTDRGAEVEKLNTNAAKKDFLELSSAIDNVENGGFKNLLYDIAENENKSKIQEDIKKYGEYLRDNKPELVKTYKKFITYIDKIKKFNNPKYTLDIHHGNFGYDKSGNLKMIDL